MSRSLKTFGFAAGAVVLTCLPAAAQTKVTNEGISASEIVIGTHQDLSGPIKGWGVPVSNGMKMAVEEINAAGGVQGGGRFGLSSRTAATIRRRPCSRRRS
ncbi:ABC-type branched-subunit amino acid transport system substrate-binding protein [Bradyrhizobium sp. GM6.1]